MPKLLLITDFPKCTTFERLSNEAASPANCRVLFKKESYRHKNFMLCVISDDDDWQVLHPVISDLRGGTKHPRRKDGWEWDWLSGKKHTQDARDASHKRFTEELRKRLEKGISNCPIQRAPRTRNVPSPQPVAASNISPAKLPSMPDYSGPDPKEKEMYDLAKDIFETAGKDKQANEYVVGYPILWFGNLNAYRNSGLKILTVGINPSKDEFPNDSFERFSAWKNLSSSGQYFEGLNKYFDQDAPYNWFDRLATKISLQDVWNCSYKNIKGRNTALHIDFYTPLATNPTWTGKRNDGTPLPRNVKESLQKPNYFQNLLGFLKPDIVFIGSGQCTIRHEAKLQSEIQQRINELTTREGKLHPNRKQLRCWWSGGNGKQKTFVVTGIYRNHPFGAYSPEKLRPIMEAMKAYYDSNPEAAE